MKRLFFFPDVKDPLVSPFFLGMGSVFFFFLGDLSSLAHGGF